MCVGVGVLCMCVCMCLCMCTRRGTSQSSTMKTGRVRRHLLGQSITPLSPLPWLRLNWPDMEELKNEQTVHTDEVKKVIIDLPNSGWCVKAGTIDTVYICCAFEHISNAYVCKSVWDFIKNCVVCFMMKFDVVNTRT